MTIKPFTRVPLALTRSSAAVLVAASLAIGGALAGPAAQAADQSAPSVSQSAKAAKRLGLHRPDFAGVLMPGHRATAIPGPVPAGARVSYRWLRDGKAIKSATKKTYSIKAADAESRLSVKLAGWDSAKTTFAYRWTRDGRTIAGATSANHKVVAKDAGTSVSVVVRARTEGEGLVVAGSTPKRSAALAPAAAPKAPEQVAQPEAPAQPEVPAQPEAPAQPEQPAAPEEPTAPEQPDQPAPPAQPERPTQPEQPTQPELPAQPEQPAQPEDPEDPAQPGDNEDSSDPSNPDDGDPTDPSNPDDGDTGDEGNTGDNEDGRDPDDPADGDGDTDDGDQPVVAQSTDELGVMLGWWESRGKDVTREELASSLRYPVPTYRTGDGEIVALSDDDTLEITVRKSAEWLDNIPTEEKVFSFAPATIAELVEAGVIVDGKIIFPNLLDLDQFEAFRNLPAAHYLITFTVDKEGYEMNWNGWYGLMLGYPKW
jgi:hypothetical protein